MPTTEKKSRTKCQPRLAFCLVGILSGWHFVLPPPYPITPFFVPSIMSLLNVSGELVMSPLDLCHTMYAYWLLHKAVPQVLYMFYSSHYRVLYPKGFLLHTVRTCTQEGILCHMSPIGLLLCIERAGTQESISYALCVLCLLTCFLCCKSTAQFIEGCPMYFVSAFGC